MANIVEFKVRNEKVSVRTNSVDAFDDFEVPPPKLIDGQSIFGFDYYRRYINGSRGKLQVDKLCICGVGRAVIADFPDVGARTWAIRRVGGGGGLDGGGVGADEVNLAVDNPPVVINDGGDGDGVAVNNNDLVVAEDDAVVEGAEDVVGEIAVVESSMVRIFGNQHNVFRGTGSKRLREELVSCGLNVNANFKEVKRPKHVKQTSNKKNQDKAYLVKCAYFAIN